MNTLNVDFGLFLTQVFVMVKKNNDYVSAILPIENLKLKKHEAILQRHPVK